jgi:hypothetical protein
MPLEVEVIGDMGEGLKLQLLVEDDGDVIVSVLPVDHKFTRQAVQFCTATGGGKDPRIAGKLRELVHLLKGPSSKPATAVQTPNHFGEEFERLAQGLGLEGTATEIVDYLLLRYGL